MKTPELRLPLQTGQSALRALAPGAAFFVPGLSGVVFGVLLFVVLLHVPQLGAYLVTVLSIGGVLLMIFASRNLRFVSPRPCRAPASEPQVRVSPCTPPCRDAS